MKQAEAKYAHVWAVISVLQSKIKSAEAAGSEGLISSNYSPGATTNVARTNDRDKPVNAAAPAHSTVSAYAPPRPAIERGDLAAPGAADAPNFVAPTAGMRGLY